MNAFLCRTAALVIFTAFFLTGCGEKVAVGFQGYAEGESLHIAAPFAGTLEQLQVARGQQVAAGAPMFALEQTNEAAQRREAEARVAAATARLINLQTGRRPSEIDTVRAQVQQAKAMRELSASQLAQQEKLFKQGFISQAKLDEARSVYQRDLARVAELDAQTRTATVSVGRVEEIDAAKRDVDVAKAVLAQSDWRVAQKSVVAPVAALVENTYFSRGEWVPAGQSVLSLLAPDKIKVRFFVPEEVLGGIKIGQSVSLSCAGCGAPIKANINFIATQPEFTPPVIYSKESHAKLVFYVEAKPSLDQAVRLHPGQPVSVSLN
ncbi:MAG: HlyD family efflux transporter periplasmic adaptor subunit [Betaproteobacteria bacterium]